MELLCILLLINTNEHTEFEDQSHGFDLCRSSRCSTVPSSIIFCQYSTCSISLTKTHPEQRTVVSTSRCGGSNLVVQPLPKGSLHRIREFENDFRLVVPKIRHRVWYISAASKYSVNFSTLHHHRYSIVILEIPCRSSAAATPNTDFRTYNALLQGPSGQHSYTQWTPSRTCSSAIFSSLTNLLLHSCAPGPNPNRRLFQQIRTINFCDIYNSVNTWTRRTLLGSQEYIRRAISSSENRRRPTWLLKRPRKILFRHWALHTTDYITKRDRCSVYLF